MKLIIIKDNKVECFSDYKAGAKRVFDRERVVVVQDHFTPNKDIKSAEQCRIVREFANEQGLTEYYEGGRVGIENILLL